jgi:hypothetical protein
MFSTIYLVLSRWSYNTLDDISEISSRIDGNLMNTFLRILLESDSINVNTSSSDSVAGTLSFSNWGIIKYKNESKEGNPGIESP